MCGRSLLAGRSGAHRWLARAGSNPRGCIHRAADPSGSVARGLEPSVMVPSLVVFIRVPSGRSETVVAAGLRSEEIRPDTSGRGARWGVREVIRCR